MVSKTKRYVVHTETRESQLIRFVSDDMTRKIIHPNEKGANFVHPLKKYDEALKIGKYAVCVIPSKGGI